MPSADDNNNNIILLYDGFIKSPKGKFLKKTVHRILNLKTKISSILHLLFRLLSSNSKTGVSHESKTDSVIISLMTRIQET